MVVIKQFKATNIQHGFTLLELVATLILIGILSVTALPRFFDSSGFEEHAYRSEVIAKLRHIQLRSMQQATTSCLDIEMDNSHIGVPDQSPCTGSYDFSDGYGSEAEDTLAVAIDGNHGVRFSSTSGNLSFSFDKLGVPQGDCTGGCNIQIIGDETLTVRIESQGYIHAN